MEKKFVLPGASCDRCGSSMSLKVTAVGISINGLTVFCNSCGVETDLKETAGRVTEASRERLKSWSSSLTNDLLELKATLPKDRAGWSEVAKDPKHPFTAALLTALLLLLLELSGFGIYMAVTWVLGNLILNPVGWVLIPLIVAIVMLHRNKFRASKLNGLSKCLNDLERKRDLGELSEHLYKDEKKRLIGEFLD